MRNEHSGADRLVQLRGLNTNNKSRRSGRSETARVLGIGLILLVLDLPVLWMVVTSFRPTNQILTNSLTTEFEGLTVGAYRSVFTTFERYILNSLIDCVIATAIVLFVGLAAAYSISRHRGRYQRSVYGILLLANVFPYVVITLPIYVIFSHVGLLNTYEGLILAYVGVNTPVATLLLVAFLSSVPRDLDEAAALDGAGPLRTLASIITPSIAQGVFVAGTVAFVNMWQDFLLAEVIVTSPRLETIPLGLNSLFGQYSTQWNEVMALSVVATIPTFLLFLGLQGRLTAGLLTGAVK